MKIIDLINKIANGEEVPKTIKYNGEIFTLRDEKDDYAKDNNWFTDRYSFLELNDEIEIIEEEKKIPEKLDLILDEQFTNDELQAYVYETQVKINQVIDYLKSKGE